MKAHWQRLLWLAGLFRATQTAQNCSELECHTTSSITTASRTESPAEPVSSPDVTHGNTTVSPPATSTASEPEDAFQKRLNMLLKEQKLVLAPGPEGKSRRRRAVMQKASEVWALFRGRHFVDTELQKRRERDLPEMDECEETVYRGITWPATPPDKCAEMDCPNWNVGIMTWCCNSRGYWKTQSPNTAQCVQPSVLLLKSQITASSKKYLADIIETVSDFVGNNSLEVGGDLVAIVDLLDTGVARSDTGDNYPGRIASAAQALRVGGLTASTVDALLSRDKPWNEVPAQTRHSCATTLLLIMDVAGIILSAASSEQKILAFINFQMNIISSTTTHIANQTMLLPAPGNSSNRTYSTAQLRIARNSSGAEEDSPLGPAGEDGAGDVVIVFTEFPRLDKLLLDDGADIEDPRQELNSPAISIRVGSEAPGLVLGAHVELALPMLHPDAENPTCVFWDTLINEWSPDGCQVGRRNGTHVVCFCQHLSNFAVLMDLHGALPRDERSTLPLRIITWTGCSASVLCLCLCVTVFGCFRSLRNTRTSIHLNLCICLLVAEVVLMFGIDQTKHKTLCATVAGLLHYFFLAAFSWILLEGFHITFILITVFDTWRKRYLRYYIFGYGMPLLVVLITAGVRPNGYGTKNNCWLSRNNGVIWSYAGPVAFVLMVNFAVLVFTIRTTCRLSKQTTSRARLETARRWIRTTVIMLPLLGLTWLPGFLILDSKPASVVATYAFCILNTSQGCALFLFHCALNRSVRRVAMRKFKSSQLFDRCLPVQWRQNSNAEERGSSSTVNSESRVIATIFGKRGSVSFDSGEAAVHDPMAGKFTSTISSSLSSAHGI